MADVLPDYEMSLREREALFRALVQQAPEAIVLLDVDRGTFVEANESAVQLFGLPAEDLLNLGPADVSPPFQANGQASRDAAASRIADALAGEHPVFEWTCRNSGGRDFPCEVRLARLPFAGRRLVRGSVTDITERKRAEEALRTAEAKYRQLVERVPAIVYTAQVGADSTWLYISPQVESLLGFTAEEWISHPALWMKQMHPEDRAVVLAKEAEYERHPAPGSNVDEYRFTTRDGREVWIRDEGTIYWDEVHQRHLWHGVFTDITERKRAEAELELAADVLNSIGDFIIVGNAQGQIVYVSRAVADILGYQPSEVLGEGWWGIENATGESRLEERRYVERAARGEIPVDERAYEHSFRRRDGEIRWLTMRDSKGPRDLIIGVGRDITERKRGERQLAAQHAVTRVLAEAETLDQATPKLLQVVCEALAWEMGAIWRVEDDSNSLACVETWVLPGAGVEEFEALTRRTTFAFGVGLPGRVLAGGAPAWIEDVVNDSNFPRAPMAARVGLHGAFGFPIHSRGQVRGVIEFFSHRVEEPDQPLLNMFDSVGSQIGQFMDRKHAEEAARENEARSRLVLDAALDAVITIDAAGVIFGWNPQAETIFGWSRAEALGRRLSETIIPSEHREAHERGLKHFLATGEGPVLNRRIEITALRRDGQVFPVELAIAPVRMDSTYTFSAFVRDITERKQAEAALRQLNAELDERVTRRTAELTEANQRLQEEIAARSRLATIIEATSDAVGTSDLQGKLQYLNRAARQLLGVGNEADIDAMLLTDIFSPEVQAYVLTEAIPTAVLEGTFSFETLMRHQDGHDIPVWLVGIAHKAPDGTPLSLSGVARDITQRKQAEAELKQAKETAEAATRAKSTFLASMSHEIRTPMNAVIGMTSLLLNTPLNPRQRDFVETIRSAGDSLLTVINDILDFSKIEAGKLELENQPFDLRACVESALDLLAPRAAEKGIELAFSMDDSVPSGILGDITRLRQILVNLVTNAVKFTERGEVVVSASAQLAADRRPPAAAPAGAGVPPAFPGPPILKESSNLEVAGAGMPAGQPSDVYELHFSVRDTGLGIPLDRMDLLFQSFSQLDASTTREHGGTGLGLAISKRLAELMGGSMWAESDGVPGRGSTFHFTLAGQPAPVPARVPRHYAGPELSGRRLLVVDDNPTNRRILAAQLQGWGIVVKQAAAPGDALAVLKQGDPFDLVVLDAHLPEMDGLALAAAIRALPPPASNLPLVLLTSAGNLDPEAEHVRLAAALTKPVKPSQLYDVLMNVFAAGLRPEPLAESAKPSSTDRALPGMPLRILLAEDVVVNQKFALAALEQLGYGADVAADGLEALDAVQRQPYDVVLMDVHMPHMDGLEATRQIHRLWTGQAARQRPYVIAMTANALEGDRELCLAAGMDDYISKPVYLDDLTAALQKAATRIQEQRVAGLAESLPAPAAPPVSPEPVDRTVLAELLLRPNGPELVNLYFEEAREFLTALASAVAAGDVVGVREVAHSLKGISGQVGAVSVAALAQAIERNARQGAVSDDTSARLAQLQAAFERSRLALLAELAGLDSNG